MALDSVKIKIQKINNGAHLDSVTEKSWNFYKSGVRPCWQRSSPKKGLTPEG